MSRREAACLDVIVGGAKHSEAYIGSGNQQTCRRKNKVRVAPVSAGSMRTRSGVGAVTTYQGSSDR